ncbi:flagellar biosynthetic protein FliR [Tabrizicola aquatica]|uniref:flagellar biosynthetic protein FliR n=1 Tax=Tabrizicola aquatica TaxID=909926 RepID=UPI000CD2D92D|nr:flagellar biosynthetic protein FliR [Tabrizicola aquatica]
MDQVAVAIVDQSKILLMAFGLGFARWFTFASVFAPFVWAQVSNGMARNAIAIGFGLPMTLLLWSTQGQVLASMTAGDFIILMAKEVILGLLLGLIASVPIWIADMAGSVLAGLLQEQDQGSGFAATPTTRIFVLIAIGLLAYEGGFRLLIGAMYESYGSWPVLAPMPQMGAEAGAALLTLLTLVFKAGFVIVAPFLLVFVLIDATVGVATRLGSKADLSPYSELYKSLALLALLMVTLFPLRGAIAENLQSFANLTAILRPFFAGSP